MLSQKQILFREMIFGTLVYSVVLGFFNDYTDILQTESYSTTFLVAIVMQLLTHSTFKIKSLIANYFKRQSKKFSKIWLVLGVWLVMFSSKFVFLAVIDFIFRDQVYVSGFVGLMLIIILMTFSKAMIDYLFKKAGELEK